ncbi:MAG: hypothetical protein Q7J80_10060 [Anaerolineales bacterium]|nr:hypothetical protein [Anaerolineales bacterium]
MVRLVLLTILISIFSLGCNISTTAPAPTPIPSPTHWIEPVEISPPGATLEPTIIPTATPARVTLLVKTQLINCRFGPGTVYQLLNELSEGQSLRAVGRNEASTWWYIQDPGNPGSFCWVSAGVTEPQGETDPLTVIPPPFVTVTNIRLRVEPNRIVVKCDQFPQTVFFEAEITTNGPTLFMWRWEASTGATSDDGTLIFEEAATQVINEYYQINAPNEYWIKLHVLTPNERVEQVNFPVSCTP